VALDMSDDYYHRLSEEYGRRRSAALRMLESAGFSCYIPHGSHYIMTDISPFGSINDVEFARYLVEHIGVAAVPGSNFYLDPIKNYSEIRFCFCKKYETLSKAGQRLASLAGLRCA
jgi:aspartate/methionine/tyrosine aminotransferase